METRAHYVLIGAFAMGTLTATFFFVIWLMKGQADREYTQYDVVFREAISGLSMASDVKFNGISVGSVIDIRLDPEDPAQVITRIQVDKATPVKVDTVAQLGYQGLTGIAHIDLKGGTQESERLTDVSEDTVPRIQADAGTISRLASEGGEVIASINEIVHRVQWLLRDENLERFDSVISNVDTLAQAFGNESETFQQAAQSTASLLAKLDATSGRLEDLVASVTAVTLQMQGFGERYGDDLLVNISSALQALSTTSNTVDAVLSENREQMAVFMERGLPEAVHTLQDTRRMLRNLDQLLRNIERDPGTYLFGVSRIAEEISQ